MNKIDADAVLKYEAVFGAKKMQKLWSEYFDGAKAQLNGIENRTAEEIRLAYHSLRSSSLVFGMVGFAKLCEQIEEAALGAAKMEKIKKNIDKSKKVFDNEAKEAADFLKRLAG